MSTTPITIHSVMRRTTGAFYTGQNPEIVNELAALTQQSLAGGTSGGSFRVWSETNFDQRVLEPGCWIFIDEDGELASMSPEEFEKHWTTGEDSSVEMIGVPLHADTLVLSDGGSVVENIQPPPTPSTLGPMSLSNDDDDDVQEMTSEEFMRRRDERYKDLNEKLAAETQEPPSEQVSAADDDDAMTEEEPESILPDGAEDWSKKEWLEYRLAQGYTKTSITGSTIAILKILPDTPPA